MWKEAAPSADGTSHGALEFRWLAKHPRQQLQRERLEPATRRSANRNSPCRPPDHFHVLLEELRSVGRARLPGNGRVAWKPEPQRHLLNSPYSQIQFEAPCAFSTCLLWS